MSREEIRAKARNDIQRRLNHLENSISNADANPGRPLGDSVIEAWETLRLALIGKQAEESAWQASRATLEPALALQNKEPGQSVKELAQRVHKAVTWSEAAKEIQSHVDQQTRDLRLALDQAIEVGRIDLAENYPGKVRVDGWAHRDEYPELVKQLEARAALSTGNNLEVE